MDLLCKIAYRIAILVYGRPTSIQVFTVNQAGVSSFISVLVERWAPFLSQERDFDRISQARSLYQPTPSWDGLKSCIYAVNVFDVSNRVCCRHQKHALTLLICTWFQAGARYHKGSVLCFLPGLPEMEVFNDDLSLCQTEDSQFQLIQLHSSVSLQRQEVIFKRPEKGMR